MIFLMVYCFSFIFLFKFFSLKNGAFMLTSLAWFWTQLSHSFLLSLSQNMCFTSFNLSAIMPLKKEAADVRAENVQYEQKISLLDLPELALESILERLPPPTLSNMTGVCSFLRERCISDYLWERQMKQKWGRLIGDAAHREWQCHIAFENRSTHLKGNKQIAFFGYASSLWPVMWGKSIFGIDSKFSSLPEDSIMAWYLALETGKFWFPAQVYNRENGSIGFMLSCYDAEVSYDSASDSFKARYSPQGRRTVEYNIGWDRIRPPAVDTPAHSLHASDCLHDLRPGDHIEIQWRRNKEFPYGWWYAVVGHLESCDGNSTHCQCHSSDTVILEFKQYTPGSRWRRTAINRKEHREVGNEADGFYGGIRKLYCEDEISLWKSLWPAQILE